MKFRPVYYMISGWPSLEKTREMVRRYVEHGVTALQFDMPGADPSRESAFIQQGMRHARALYGEDYDVFMDALRGIERKVVTFGLSPKADVYAENIIHRGSSSEFDIYHRGNLFAHVTLHVPGIHNVRNALAATAAAIVLGVSPNAVKYGLAGFEGAGRRFDYKGKFQGADLYDDYAHHPSELRALLDAVDTLDYQRTIVVFQPHTYSRTKFLFDAFGEAFTDADEVIIADIYAARESDDGTISAAMLADRIAKTGKSARYVGDFNAIRSYLEKNCKAGDLLLTVGAGDVFKIGEAFLEN